ncbi:hypothetical protein ACP70R_027378 [Stipagrostis hirtigluma subsp. patula]
MASCPVVLHHRFTIADHIYHRRRQCCQPTLKLPKVTLAGASSDAARRHYPVVVDGFLPLFSPFLVHQILC